VDNQVKSNILGIPLRRLAKLFLFATVFPIILVSILGTLLPKRHASFQVLPKKTPEAAPLVRARLKPEPPLQPTLQAKVVPSQKSIPLTIEEVKQALVSGRYSDLNILRPENLGDSVLKEATLLPQIKSLLLSQLQSIMEYEDWHGWKESLTRGSPDKSKARAFVDNIRTVNFQLGRYLETAALLFSALYINTSNGRLFSSEESLYNLLLQSNELFSQRTPTAISSRIYLDTVITDDLIFVDTLESLRVKFVLSYCLKRPEELDTQFLLLSSIKPKNFTDEVIDLYSNAILRVSAKVSPRFREELRSHYFQPEKAKEISAISKRLEEAVFTLYHSNIEDYVKEGDLGRAKSNFLQLASVATDQDKLSKIQEIINKEAEAQKVQQVETTNVGLAKTDVSEAPDSALRLFPSAQIAGAGVAKKIEWYGFLVALIVFVAIIIKRTRNIILAVLVWLSSRLLQKFKSVTSRKAKNEEFIEELDASIKAGKTVPMANIPRRQAGKKAVNS